MEQARQPSTGQRPTEPRLNLPNPDQYKGIILSLCEESGAWSGPYVEQGYAVIRVDPKFGEWRELYNQRGMTDRLCGTGLEKRPVEPVFYTDKKGRRLSWLAAKLGGKSERTKELRSKTPVGFSRAFAAANP